MGGWNEVLDSLYGWVGGWVGLPYLSNVQAFLGNRGSNKDVELPFLEVLEHLPLGCLI